jgi:hypothetical protein
MAKRRVLLIERTRAISWACSQVPLEHSLDAVMDKLAAAWSQR